jgi:hypothetical protein
VLLYNEAGQFFVATDAIVQRQWMELPYFTHDSKVRQGTNQPSPTVRAFSLFNGERHISLRYIPTDQPAIFCPSILSLLAIPPSYPREITFSHDITTMRFFRKKDKRKDKPFGLPGFGGGEEQNGDGKRKPSGSSPQYSGSGGAAATRAATAFRPMATHRSAAVLQSLPPHVLEKIFAFVCPHAVDDSYQTCEESGSEDACMLCDLRDLAHCVAVCKKWRTEAIKLL